MALRHLQSSQWCTACLKEAGSSSPEYCALANFTSYDKGNLASQMQVLKEILPSESMEALMFSEGQ